MTNEEAIKLIDDRMCWGRGGWSKHHMPEIDEYWQAGLMAIEALKAQSYASERYDDLCKYFKGSDDGGESILHDGKEFNKWLERMKWHVIECDKLARELEKLKAQDVPDTNVGSKGGDTIYRQAAIDLVEGLESARLKGKIDLLYPKVVKGLIGLPSAQPEDWMERNKERILQAGMEGREIEFRIGGRLFTIREKAQ